MAGLNSPCTDKPLLQILSEIGLIQQLYEEFITSKERTVVSLPSRNYARSLSFGFFDFVSEFYSAFLRQSLPERTCSFCFRRHDLKYLCLPNLFQKDTVDLLFDILEWKRAHLSFADDLISLVRLCGFLLIKSDVMHAFLVNMLPLEEVGASKRGPAFAYELYHSGFLATSKYYAEAVDHPAFYSLLETFPNYRSIRHKLHSFHRFRKFARTYTYPSGQVKFSKVRAAFFWDYFQPPEPVDYPEGW